MHSISCKNAWLYVCCSCTHCAHSQWQSCSSSSEGARTKTISFKIYCFFNCNIMHTGINSCCVNRPNRQIDDLCSFSRSLSLSLSLSCLGSSAQPNAASNIEKKRRKLHICAALSAANGVRCRQFFSIHSFSLGAKNHLFSNREVNNNNDKKRTN